MLLVQCRSYRSSHQVLYMQNFTHIQSYCTHSHFLPMALKSQHFQSFFSARTDVFSHYSSGALTEVLWHLCLPCTFIPLQLPQIPDKAYPASSYPSSQSSYFCRLQKLHWASMQSFSSGGINKRVHLKQDYSR